MSPPPHHNNNNSLSSHLLSSASAASTTPHSHSISTSYYNPPVSASSSSLFSASMPPATHHHSAYPQSSASTNPPPLTPAPHSSAVAAGLPGHATASHHATSHTAHNPWAAHASYPDVKPQYLADWYAQQHSAAVSAHHMSSMTSMTSGSAVARSPYDHSKMHVSAALPTPPSTGHSPIQSLSNHLHLLPGAAATAAPPLAYT